MKFYGTAFTLLSVFLSGAALAAEQAYKAKLASSSLLLDIEIVNDQLMVVGERGHILRSTDAQNWSQDEVPSLATLTAISSVGGNTWVVGHDATILFKATDGDAWSVQNFQPELERPLLDVMFFDEQHGITVGAYGMFYRTRDGGNTWQSEAHPEFLHPDDQEYLEEIKLEDEAFYLEELNSILPHLNRISRFDDRLYLAGETGLLAFSDDLGRNWQRMEINYEGSFFDIRKLDSGKLLAAGLRGNLFEFDPEDQNWFRIDSGSQSSLNSIVETDNQEALVVGNNGNLVCMADRIVEQEQTPESEAIMNAVSYNGHLVAVTAVGIQILDSQKESSTCKRINSSL